jgi:hypothetical protein
MIQRRFRLCGGLAHTATWELPVAVGTSPDEAQAFVGTYGAEHLDRDAVFAAATYFSAYCARCQSCRDEAYQGGFQNVLRPVAEAFL